MSVSINPKVLRQPKISKKISEVKEVVQNRSDVDIAKVLEYFEYDVGKSIDAFVSDGGKQALSKWSEAKSQLNSSQSSLISEKPAKKSNKPNLNDLVASVIDQYTSASLSSTPAASMSPPEPLKSEVLLDTINRLNGAESSLNGYKVTILGIETPKVSQSNSSSSTSPSSMSVASSASFERPQQLELPKFNKSFVNPNAKQLLEKPIKDLHRQTLQLNKIQSSIQEQVSVSTQLLNKTYQQLLNILAERKAQLEVELKTSSQHAIALVQQRQSKAANLKLIADNAQHLSDAECNELRADIKHFVSERLIDEQLTKINFFSTQSSQMDLIVQELGSFGTVNQVKNEYSTKRPANVEDILSPVENVVEAKPQRVIRKNVEVVNVNGGSVHDVNDGQGEFIEVKKPRKHF